MEIMQSTMAELSETLRELSATGSPQEKAAQQTEKLKQAYEKAVANTKELADLIQHANGEALAMLNKRFVEAMEEAKTLLAMTKSA
jgi:phasin family protein